MKLSRSVRMIGDLLTDIDATLARDDFHTSEPSWHQLYALRKHLDDQQRTLVRLPGGADEAQKEQKAEEIDPLISEASIKLAGANQVPSELGGAIDQIAQVTASVERFLRYVEPGPKDNRPKRRSDETTGV